jgi:hypothetical protein
VVAMVLRRGMALVAVGGLSGAVPAAVGDRLLSSVLFVGAFGEGGPHGGFAGEVEEQS